MLGLNKGADTLTANVGGAKTVSPGPVANQNDVGDGRGPGSLSIFAVFLVLSVSCFVCQSKAVLCPMSGQPIRMNELLDVKFTALDPSLDRVALLTRQVSPFNRETI